jgi:hypothetical protein
MMNDLPDTVLGKSKEFGQRYKGFSLLVAQANFFVAFTLGGGDMRNWPLRKQQTCVVFEDHAARGIGQLLKYGYAVKVPTSHVCMQTIMLPFKNLCVITEHSHWYTVRLSF